MGFALLLVELMMELMNAAGDFVAALVLAGGRWHQQHWNCPALNNAVIV